MGLLSQPAQTPEMSSALPRLPLPSASYRHSRATSVPGTGLSTWDADGLQGNKYVTVTAVPHGNLEKRLIAITRIQQS